MQSLKEFTIYTKKTIGVKDTYALRENVNALGVSKNLLAEGAGANIAMALLHKHKNDSILIVSGCGNKGAIGLSVARHLYDYVHHMDVALLCKPEEIKQDVLRCNYNILSKFMDIEIIEEEHKLKRLVKSNDIVVDAIIGVGLRGRPDKRIASAINVINKYGKYIVSIDIPSGIDPETGLPNVASIKPDMLFVLYKNKPFTVTRKFVQNTSIIDIGVPSPSELIVGPGDVMLATEPRLMHANKYTNGSVLVVGGSTDYSGAPVLTAYSVSNALSALYTGVGYVTIAMPNSAIKKVNIPPELIVKSFNDKMISKEDLIKLGEIRHDVLAIGPGLSSRVECLNSIREFIASESAHGKYIVVDATAIKALSANKNLLGKNIIITPHDGEFSALTGINLRNATLKKRIYSAIEFAKTYSCTVVLKGHETIITDGQLLKINFTDTPVLATMGSGDVLTGIIASYLAMHKVPFESAVAGVYVSSKIGEILFKEMGLHITANDIVNKIPQVIKEFDSIK
ncbi:MAG: NAD(P)H-hydrate dehydratase [Candidatus Micrarchaeia archaeon]